MGTSQYTLNSSKLWQIQGTKGLKYIYYLGHQVLHCQYWLGHYVLQY